MTSWTKELDEAAILATQKGSWHILLFYLLCGLASIPSSFLVFSQLFTNATPDHWCAPPPELEVLELSDDLLRNLTVPMKNGLYETCSSYILDTRAVFATLSDYVDERVKNYCTRVTEELTPKWLLQPTDANNFNRKRLQIWNVQGARIITDFVVSQLSPQISRVVEVITSFRSKQTPCLNGWRFSTEQYTKTLVTKYSLVCEKEWMPRTSNTLFWVGSIFGNLLFGWMSDRHGRRPTILLIISLEVPLAIAAAFSSSYMTYTALRVVSGLFFPAMYQLPFVLALELMPPARRTNAGIFVGMLFAGGISLLALIAYAVRDWFYLSLATSLPFILLYGYYWLIPESPRWLVGRGRIAEAEKVLRELAKKNGIDLAPEFLMEIHKEFKNENNADERSYMLSTFNRNVVGFPEILDRGGADLRISNSLKFKPEITIVPENRKHNEIHERILMNNAEKTGPDNGLDGNTMTNIGEFPPNSELRNNSKKSMCHYNSPSKSLKTRILRLVTRMFRKYDSVDRIEYNITEDQNSERCCKASPLDLFRYPNLRKKFLILTFDWLSLGVIYNSLSYNTSNLGVNIYLAFFIGGAVEIPSYVIAWRCMERFGRRWVLCIFMCIGGLACLSCILVPEDMPWVTVFLAMLGRLCAAASFAVFYVVIGELLPTVLRSQAMGLVSFISGLGLLACPYIAHLAVYVKTLPLIVMGVLSVMVGVTSLFLPETLNQPLPQTLEDGEMFGREFKLLSCVASPVKQ